MTDGERYASAISGLCFLGAALLLALAALAQVLR